MEEQLGEEGEEAGGEREGEEEERISSMFLMKWRSERRKTDIKPNLSIKSHSFCAVSIILILFSLSNSSFNLFISSKRSFGSFSI